MYPRAKALGIIMSDNKILLEELNGEHSKGMGLYYRPIGGSIEYGEKSDETIIREYKEEIGAEIEIISYISCLENIFTIGLNVGHEIIQIYFVKFKETTLYKHGSFKIIEGSKVTYAKWIPLKDIFDRNKILYPNGLKELLQNLLSSD
jgi:ADP-ribose pyrophosphatase YjhB (NUDIX family)